MSGGHFEYKDSGLKHEIFGWSETPHNVLEDRELSELTWDLLDLLHEYDWYICGDTGKDTWLKAKAEFKKKWLDNRGVRVRRIVDEAIDSLRQELYETYGIEQEPNRWLADGIAYKCPVCGKTLVVEQGDADMNFCPHCGTRMEE